MLFELSRAALFRLPPETAHTLALRALDTGGRLVPAARFDLPRRVMGLDFPNPVGLAAGLDKNGDHIDALGRLGFGFIEVGTVTPRPQPGNPRPRVFRLTHARALINRLGFNNKGVDHLVARLARSRYTGVIGVNIGKNRDTPVERAVDDYLICLRKVYPHAGYVTINVSSPNTPGLRDLQHGEQLAALLNTLKREQGALAERHGRYVPLAVKIAPDMDEAQFAGVARVLAECRADAVIATNTTASRQGVDDGAGPAELAAQQGGLSGAPLTARATAAVALLHGLLGEAVPVIAAGGTMSGADARAKFDAGARLVQLYTGLIYHGPALIREVARACPPLPEAGR